MVNFRGCCHFPTIWSCTNRNTDLKLCGFTPLDDKRRDACVWLSDKIKSNPAHKLDPFLPHRYYS